MKTVRNKKDHTGSDNNWQLIAEAHEREGELKEAVAAYKKLVKTNPLNEKAYNKLMMIYRQLNDYKEELKTINTAINAFEEVYKKKYRLPGKKILQLSKALQKVTGLTDKKGKDVFRPDPIARWEKRKTTVLKRLKKRVIQ